MQLAPEHTTAELQPATWSRIPVSAVAVGQRLRVEKGSGDPVFAGSLDTSGALEIEATSMVSTSTLARIIHAVEEAEASRAPIQGFVDRFAARCTPALFVLALAVALLAPSQLGSATLWQAVFAVMGTSLLVIANGLRLLRQCWD